MTRSRMNLLLLISVLLLSSFTVLNPVNADSHIIPKIGDGQPTPDLDGNITATEWNTSVSFDTSLHNQETSVYVTTNSTHLFIGFNMSSTGFVSVNDTVPAYNHTIANYTLGYNNQSHDWFALVLDNNVDRDTTDTTIGTGTSPDDALVIDQYVSGAYDAFANGSVSPTFVPDQSITYNGTVDAALTAGEGGEIVTLGIDGTTVEGPNGTLDGDVSRNITSDQVIYEVIKPIDKLDEEGHDFILNDLGILQFRLYQWKDAQANDTLQKNNVDFTDWFSLRINDTGTGLATQTAGNTTINVVHDAMPADQVDALKTVSELYGFDISLTGAVSTSNFSAYDLNIFFFDENVDWSDDQIGTMIDFIRTGGNAIILLGDGTNSGDIASEFELNFLPNQVLTPTDEEVGNTDIEINGFTDQLSFFSGDAVVTSQPLNTLQLQSYALNISQIQRDNNSYVLDQEYLSYDLFTPPTDAVYDETGEGAVNDTETFGDDVSLGVAFDFLKGGRASIIPSTSLFSDKGLGNADNLNYLIRLLPWNARTIDTLDVQSSKTGQQTILQGSSVSLEVNVTDGFGEVPPSELTVLAEVKIAGNTINRTTLTLGTNGTFTGSVTILENGYMTIEITAFRTGYGFAEGETQNIFVERRVQSFNDLSELSIIIIVLFALSLVSLVIIYGKIKNY